MSTNNNCESSDEALVKAIRMDDREAFKHLYYRYFKLLTRFALYRLHSLDIVKDLVQELFFKLWFNRNSLDAEKSIKAYLYKSLNNQIINYSKLHSSHNTSLDSINRENMPDKEPDIDLKMDVQNAVNHLPEKLKAVYLLSRVEGYKYSEIAEICDISVKAVEKRMTNVFKLLKESLSDKYF